jgi:hypothetical protein
MKFRIEFDCDNAAFDDARDIEIADILVKVAGSITRDMPRSGTSYSVLDSNGNRVGYYSLNK